jgi:hypothetical protein
MYTGFLLVFAFITFTFQKTDKIKKLAFILWPAKDAFRNDFSASPANILERLKDKSVSTACNNLPKVLRSLIPGQEPTLQQFEKA